MTSRVTIPPVAEPISLVEGKLHLRVDNTADDELIKTLITASRSWCEEAYEGRAYIVRTSQLKVDSFGKIALPFPPVQSISSITYIDTAGDTQTLSSAVYNLYNSGDYAYIDTAYNQSWPSVRGDVEGITITYVHGYSTTLTTVYGTGVCTVGNAIFANADLVRVEAGAADLPAGLAVETDYYVGDVSGLTLKLYSDLALTTEITLTDNGTTPNYIALGETGLVPACVKAAIKLLLTHLYENRSQTTALSLTQIPMGVKNLLFERCW